MRAFIAIDLPENIRAALGRKQAELRNSLAKMNPAQDKRDTEIRWTKPEAIHLTLKFLGEIPQARINQVIDSLSAIWAFESFPVEVKGFGFFPSPSRPQVFWAGVEAPPALAHLARKIEEAMEKIGFAPEKRNYSPHLTLARFKIPRPRPELQSLVETQNKISMGRFEAREFFLFESKLSPRGAEYGKVARFPH
ncbi:MAG: RNA 2',3'-cyclic phosphodiesterase [Terriglobia bacterium]